MARRDKELLIFLSKHLIFISRFLIPNLFADIVYFVSPIYTSYYADRFSRKNFDLQNAFFMDPPWYVKKSMTIGKLGKLELISTNLRSTDNNLFFHPLSLFSNTTTEIIFRAGQSGFLGPDIAPGPTFVAVEK